MRGVKELDYFEVGYNPSGRGSRCKKCASAASVAWAKANPDKLKGNLKRKKYLRDRQLGFKLYWETHDPYMETKIKVCAKCGTERLSKLFPKSTCEKDGLQAYCMKRGVK